MKKSIHDWQPYTCYSPFANASQFFVENEDGSMEPIHKKVFVLSHISKCSKCGQTMGLPPNQARSYTQKCRKPYGKKEWRFCSNKVAAKSTEERKEQK